MNTFILITGVLLGLFSSKVDCKIDKYMLALEFIKNDSTVNPFFDSNIPLRNSFRVSDKVIPFNIITVSEEIIRKNYLDDYSAFKDLTNAERLVVRHVSDSIYNIESLLNEKIEGEKSDIPKKLVRKNKGTPIYILFFSQLVNNKLYVEVMMHEGTYIKENTVYGSAKTYYFTFDQKDIRIANVYKGNVHHN